MNAWNICAGALSGLVAMGMTACGGPAAPGAATAVAPSPAAPTVSGETSSPAPDAMREETIPPSEAPELLHPRAFELVTCWMSDTVQPVATELSLDAIAGNDDQFIGPVTRDGEWVQAPGSDGEGFLRYRVLGRDTGGVTMVEFQANAGGTLTSSARIGYRLIARTFDRDGRKQGLRVLRVVRFDDK